MAGKSHRIKCLGWLYNLWIVRLWILSFQFEFHILVRCLKNLWQAFITFIVNEITLWHFPGAFNVLTCKAFSFSLVNSWECLFASDAVCEAHSLRSLSNSCVLSDNVYNRGQYTLIGQSLEYATLQTRALERKFWLSNAYLTFSPQINLKTSRWE